MILYVKKFKKKNDADCIALMCSNGRYETALSFDHYIISDYLGIKRKDLKTLEYGRTYIIDVERVRKE